jgi:tetratricopeptide (TPR) repeat protein
VSAARHYLASDDRAAALELVYSRRDDVIAGGEVEQLEQLATDIGVAIEGAGRTAYRLHALVATCHGVRGNYADAARFWGFGLEGDIDELEAAEFHIRRGDCYRLMSDYDTAQTDYDAAAMIATGHRGDTAVRQRGRALLGLAKLNRLRAAYPLATANYRNARDAFEAAFDHIGVIESDFGLGEVSRLLESWADSAAGYCRSLARARARRSLEREAYALWGVGEILRLCGEHEDALRNHREGLALCTQVGDTRSEGWAFLGLAETWRAAGEHERATSDYEHALARFGTTASETERAHAMLGLAENRRAQGRLCLELYSSARVIYDARGLRHSLAQCCVAEAAGLRTSTSEDADHRGAELLQTADGLAIQCDLKDVSRLTDAMKRDADSAPHFQLNFP